jgi:oligopeptide transport system ATP-binding protein
MMGAPEAVTTAQSAVESGLVLKVEDLRAEFATQKGVVPAVRGISFSLRRGEALGLVGESGSGKSATCMSLLGLLSKPGRVAGGKAMFAGHDLLNMNAEKKRSLLGSRIGTILQDPMTSLNPAYSIGNQVGEVLRIHRSMRGHALEERVCELLISMGIPSPAMRLRDYPHLLSGGMRQRVVAAMAIACNPDLLIADEPTTALDVTTSARFLRLLAAIQRKSQLAIIFVTHNFDNIRQLCDRVAVMYAGKIVEIGSTDDVMENPRHPYTRALLDSIPSIDQKTDRLCAIRGHPPNMITVDSGCAFRDRCGRATEICATQPPSKEYASKHQVNCWHDLSPSS